MTQNYHEKYAQITAELRKRLKLRKHGGEVTFIYEGEAYNIACRADRIALVDDITANYLSEHSEYVAERPRSQPVNSAILESLADAILDEELTDTHPDKLTREEYPFMSEHQLEQRYFREVGEQEDAGIDGKLHRKPLRRERTDAENRHVNNNAYKRNKERARRYNEQSRDGRCIPYNLRDTDGVLSDEFVQCVGIGTRWREYIAQETEICGV